MGVYVDVEREPPVRLRRLEVGTDGNSGVREEQIDRTERRFGRSHQLLVAGFGADINGKRDSAVRSDLVEILHDRGQRVRLTVRGDDASALGMKPLGQRPPDAVRGARDNNMTSVEFHCRRW